MNPYKTLGGQALVYGMGNIVPRVLNYAILTFYYTRKFSVEEYGVITELYAYVAILLVILTYGMETGLFRFSAGSYNKNKVFKTSFVSVATTSVIFFILVLTGKQSIAQMTGYPENPEYIVYLGVILAADAIAAIIFAKLRIENKVRKFAGLKIINVVMTIAFVLFFLELMPGISRIANSEYYLAELKDIGIGYVLIANMIASLAILLLLLKEIGTDSFTIDVKLLRKILYYSLPLLISGLAGMFNESIDRILIKNFADKQLNPLYELGIYGANFRIAVLMTLFIQMFRYAAEPFFFNQLKSKDAHIIYADVLKYFTIFMMGIFLLVTFYIDIFKFFIDPDFHDGLKIVPIILFANLLVGMLFNVNMWYKLTGQTIYGVLITGTGALITIGLNILFIPKYSYMACAWIHVAANVAMLGLTYFAGRKHFKVNYDLKRIGLYIGFGLILFAISYVLRTEIMMIDIATGTLLLFFYMYVCNKKENLINIFAGKNKG